MGQRVQKKTYRRPCRTAFRKTAGFRRNDEKTMSKDRTVTVRYPDEMSERPPLKTFFHANFRARWVSRIFTEDHKGQRKETAREFLEARGPEGEEFSDSIVTEDETWVHYTRHQKRRNNPVSGKIQSRRSRASLNTVLSAKFLPANEV